MSDTAINQATQNGKRVVVSRIANPDYVEGRRNFFKYRDLGVTSGSNGELRAQITEGSAGMIRPTGWHYHVCDGQFVYMIQGWVELEFADGKNIRIGEGDSIFIPGGIPHNEIATSENIKLIEVSIPADMGTEVCEPPSEV